MAGTVNRGYHFKIPGVKNLCRKLDYPFSIYKDDPCRIRQKEINQELQEIGKEDKKS